MSRIRGVLLTLFLSVLLTAVRAEVAVAQQRPSGRRPTTPANDAPAAKAERPAVPAVEPLRTAVDRPIDIKDIRLDLRVDLAKKIAEGTATIQIRGLRALKHLELDAAAFHVKKATLAMGNDPSSEVRYTHDGKKLTILLPSPWPAGQEATLRVDYRVEDPR
jgi:aminopeptidase N